jgi:hypothetical protein
MKICFSCFHWHKACQWIDTTIDMQRAYHPDIVAAVEREYASARADFRRSILAKERPLARAPIPIRLVRLELRILAADIDALCQKIAARPLGSLFLSQCDDEMRRNCELGEGPSASWKTICAWRENFLDTLWSVREEKRSREEADEPKATAGA